MPVGKEDIWVAEAFEPWLMTDIPDDYELMSEKYVDTINRNDWRIKIIGTISLHQRESFLLPRVKTYGFIKDFALVDRFCESRAGFQRIALPLIERALASAHYYEFKITEAETNECHIDLRESMIKAGFDTVQCYHKYLFLEFSPFKYMVSILQIEMHRWNNAKRNNSEENMNENLSSEGESV